METARQQLAAALKEARLAGGFQSQGALAKRLLCSRAVVNKAESGTQPVPHDALLTNATLVVHTMRLEFSYPPATPGPVDKLSTDLSLGLSPRLNVQTRARERHRHLERQLLIVARCLAVLSHRPVVPVPPLHADTREGRDDGTINVRHSLWLSHCLVVSSLAYVCT